MTHTRSLLSTACDGGVSPNVPQLVPCSCWTPCAHSPQPHQLSPSWLQTPHRGAPLEQPPHPAHPTKGCSEGCWGGPIPSATAHHVPLLPGGFPVLLQGPDSFAQQPHGAQHLPPARLHEALPSEGGGGICGQGVRWEGDGTRSLPPCAGVPRSPPFSPGRLPRGGQVQPAAGATHGVGPGAPALTGEDVPPHGEGESGRCHLTGLLLGSLQRGDAGTATGKGHPGEVLALEAPIVGQCRNLHQRVLLVPPQPAELALRGQGHRP